jgi:hypothetical protein
MIPATPHSAASLASLGAKIPFNMMGREEFLFIGLWRFVLDEFIKNESICLVLMF